MAHPAVLSPPERDHPAVRSRTRADWTFYSGPWPVLAVTYAAILVGLVLRTWGP